MIDGVTLINGSFSASPFCRAIDALCCDLSHPFVVADTRHIPHALLLRLPTFADWTLRSSNRENVVITRRGAILVVPSRRI